MAIKTWLLILTWKHFHLVAPTLKKNTGSGASKKLFLLTR